MKSTIQINSTFQYENCIQACDDDDKERVGMVAAYVHICESSAAADHHREVANQAEWWKNETLLISKL